MPRRVGGSEEASGCLVVAGTGEVDGEEL